MSAIEEPTVVSEPTEKTKKAMLRGYRQKLMTIKARINASTVKMHSKP